MEVTNDTLVGLAVPFYANELEWKPQAFDNKNKNDATRAMLVTYVTARAIMDRLDNVVGSANWQTHYTMVGTSAVQCRLLVKVGTEWVFKEDIASLNESKSDRIDPFKAAYSNALKRAAVQWGIGRYLYDLPSPWVDLDARKNPILSQIPVLDRRFLPEDADARGNKPGTAVSTETARKQETFGGTSSNKPVKQTAKKPAEKAQAPATKEAVPAMSVDQAGLVVIPESAGVPMAGISLVDALKELDGAFITRYLAGAVSRRDGSFFSPNDEHGQAVQDAARVLVSAGVVPDLKKN